jgi:hypothetical protein
LILKNKIKKISITNKTSSHSCKGCRRMQIFKNEKVKPIDLPTHAWGLFKKKNDE